MNTKRIAIAAAAFAALAGGSAGAIAATSAKQAEQAVIDSAAEKLDVTPQELRDALGDALDSQLDQAVEDGELTQEQADAMKEHRRESGRVLGIGPGGPGFHRRGGPGGHPRGGPMGGHILDDVADAVGISRRALFRRLRSGETIAEIAEAEGKSLADVKAAVRAAVAERLEEKVQSGDLTEAQRDEMLEHLDEHIDRLGDMPPRPPHNRRP